MYVLACLKAIAAALAVFIGAGVVKGHWLADWHIALSLVNAGIVWLTPNARRAPVARHLNIRIGRRQPDESPP